jgi:hypothetical protein
MSSSNSIVALVHRLIGPFADPRVTGHLRPRLDVSPDLLGFGAYADVGADGITIDAQVEALHIDTERPRPTHGSISSGTPWGAYRRRLRAPLPGPGGLAGHRRGQRHPGRRLLVRGVGEDDARAVVAFTAGPEYGELLRAVFRRVPVTSSRAPARAKGGIFRLGPWTPPQATRRSPTVAT